MRKATNRIKRRAERKMAKGKKPILIGSLITLVVLLVSSLLYCYVIPRIELKLKTVYHEGFLMAINVNTKIQNVGNVEVTKLRVNLTVMNTTGVIIEAKEVNYDSILPGNEEEPKLSFTGSHYIPYYIRVQLNFIAGGKKYSESYNYHADEKPMNIVFEERIFYWGL
jgi:competence protein ComGC